MEFLSKSGLSFFKSLLDLYFATKSYVNKAISTNTGKFWGTYNSLADLQEITGSNGDYAYVIVPDDYSTSYDRYKWQDGQWVYEYTVGGESFDDDQWAAINSGITASDKARLDEISENIGNNSISEMRSDIDANTSEIAEINEELGDIDAALATKANVDGYYESMAVGQADNLKGQVLIPNDAAFRTIGGSENVDSGIAHLQNVQGNTVSWNSMARNGGFVNTDEWGQTYSTMTVLDGVATITKVSVSFGAFVFQSVNIIAGHKYYLSCECKSNDANYNAGISFCAGNMTLSGNTAIYNTTPTTMQRISGIVEGLDTSKNLTIRVGVSASPVGTSGDFAKVMCIDLTLIYGAGNEPTTVEQFEADYEKWFGKPLTYEPYNAGTLIPCKTTSLKTTEFNQWDEEWENGEILASNGQNAGSNSIWRSKNYIHVFPNTEYYAHSISAPTGKPLRGRFYDANKNYLGYSAKGGEDVIVGRAFTTPDNACYMRFAPNIADIPNHDICVNISDTARNGEYEPYESHTLQLPITTLTGKLNGEGESVVVFPDGMKKAGSVQDEIYISGDKTYAVKRVGSVDLGSLTWNKGTYSFYSQLSGFKNSLMCAKYKTYDTATSGQSMDDKSIAKGPNVTPTIYVRDDSYTNSSSFTTAMQGVILYYELATPRVYELDDFALPQRFKVNDFGTEEQVHAEGVASVPAILSSLYAVNAVDTIRRLPQNYISQESMDNFLARLGAAMGGTWTKTFNTETNEFEFSFVQSASLMSVSNNEESNNEEES